jgi:hypothetical protein
MILIMVAASPLNTDDFLHALRISLLAAPREAVSYAQVNATSWSSFMFGVLERVAATCGMVSCAARHGTGPDWARREHLFDVTWFRTNCGDWETPELILEHENQHNQTEFLKDFWKLLLGYAPMRVMIGYCSEASKRIEWIEKVNEILTKSKSHIRFPNAVDDVILLGYYGMSITDFAVYRRYDSEFQKSADSLEALIPDPDEDMSVWDDYLRKAQLAMTDRVHAEVDRLQRLGIIDERGELLIKTLPPDMAPGTRTSIITG